ncbi:cytochrome P450 [Lentithecium fluviatile CBS 122367]|uniref:Cytochrome P450 n=1 Tax=Lentithecium fluviatile CBS 122367 TaxID=1168545 RepID=A0A6G1IH26_9PLEO|nr:cytochrome P450 [Lentithecium fluviatile CBS 122367]
MISNNEIAVLFLCLFTTYKVANLFRWYRAAKATGLPIVITPVLETEIWGYVLTPILRRVYYNYLLQGRGWPQWCRFMIKDWAWEDKRRAHDKFGDVFLVVSPEGIICYSANAPFNHDVMNRRSEFTKPRDKYKLLEPYGPNVATAEGKTYRFHVRITAPPFSDANGANDLVFSETMTQTKLLMQSWSHQASDELQLDVNGLTLAVISMAGFGKQLDWTSNSDDNTSNIPLGYDQSFLRAINDTTGYMTAILLLPKWLLRLTSLRCAAVAHDNLDRYMREMIRAEREKIHSDSAYESTSARGNLLTSLLKASALEGATDAKRGSSTRKEAFTEDEVMGNLFIYLLAGYETTANAILYGLIVLALRPDIQAKCIAEIDRIYVEAAAESRSTLTYADDFEKLEYLYGFMYETFRLYPGVIMITKMVKKDTIVTIPGDGSGQPPRTILLPRECRVYLNSPATQYSERYWPEPEKLDPHRWDKVVRPVSESWSEKEGKHNVVAADKTRQMRGTFLTFSDGARACLGRKFAQAEYIAFLVTLLRKYEVVLGEGTDRDLGQKDLDLRCAGKVTLAPVDNYKLKLVKRN